MLPADSPRSASERGRASQMRMQCGSILLMVTFFVFGSLMAPLREWNASYHSEPIGNIHQSSASLSLSESSSVAKKTSRDTSTTPVVLSADPAVTIDNDRSILPPPQTNFSGVLARPFEPWKHPLPCYPPDANWSAAAVLNYPSNRGFLFVVSDKSSQLLRCLGSRREVECVLATSSNIRSRLFSHNSTILLLPETTQNRVINHQWHQLAHCAQRGHPTKRGL